MVTKPSTEQTQDFSIHNEDFPALPGPNYKDATLSNDDGKTVSVSHCRLAGSAFLSVKVHHFSGSVSVHVMLKVWLETRVKQTEAPVPRGRSVLMEQAAELIQRSAMMSQTSKKRKKKKIIPDPVVTMMQVNQPTHTELWKVLALESPAWKLVKVLELFFHVLNACSEVENLS